LVGWLAIEAGLTQNSEVRMTGVESSRLWMCERARLPLLAVSRAPERLRQSLFTHGIAPGSTIEPAYMHACLLQIGPHAHEPGPMHQNTPEAPGMSKTSPSELVRHPSSPSEALVAGTRPSASPSIWLSDWLERMSPLRRRRVWQHDRRLWWGSTERRRNEEVEALWCKFEYAVEGE